MALDIRHEPENTRFVTEVEGKEGVLSYKKAGDGVLDFKSTLVAPELRGRDIGQKLVLHGLDHARSEGLKVIPTCPFVGRVIERHPEYRDLLADQVTADPIEGDGPAGRPNEIPVS